MKFKLQNGEMMLVEKRKPLPTPKLPKYKYGTMALSIAPIPIMLATTGSGVFWNTFQSHIFPWMLDIAKVFCAIKIAQGFYQERSGGREGGTGMASFVHYGKFYLLFALIPWIVELVDELGSSMLNDLRN